MESRHRNPLKLELLLLPARFFTGCSLQNTMLDPSTNALSDTESAMAADDPAYPLAGSLSRNNPVTPMLT